MERSFSKKNSNTFWEKNLEKNFLKKISSKKKYWKKISKKKLEKKGNFWKKTQKKFWMEKSFRRKRKFLEKKNQKKNRFSVLEF